MGASRHRPGGWPSLALGALCVVVLSGLLSVAPLAEAQGVSPTVAVQSAEVCLGPRALVQVSGRDWRPPEDGWSDVVQVELGPAPIGRARLVESGGELSTWGFAETIRIPEGRGGQRLWTFRQFRLTEGPADQPRAVLESLSREINFDATRFTCSPAVVPSASCIGAEGGRLALTGQVNRALEEVDIAFDVPDNGAGEAPADDVILEVGRTEDDGRFAVAFNVPALEEGRHRIYVGDGGPDADGFFFHPDDQGYFRNGQFQPGKLVFAEVDVPCVQAASPALEPTSHTYGDHPVGSATPAVAFTVRNQATGQVQGAIASLVITRVSISGPASRDFVMDDDTCTGASLEPGAACSARVHFAPSALGLRSATLTVAGDGGASVNARLVGRGRVRDGLTLLPSEKDFRVVPLNIASPVAEFTVGNGTEGDLTLSVVALSGEQATDFAVEGGSCVVGGVLPSAGTCTVRVVFTPSARGLRAATLVVAAGLTSGGAPALVQRVTASLRGRGDSGPILRFTPVVTRAGSVATLRGERFPPLSDVVLTWRQPGLPLPLRATTDAGGTFLLRIVVRPDEPLGPRTIDASGGGEPASASLLVEVRPARPQNVTGGTVKRVREATFNLVSR